MSNSNARHTPGPWEVVTTKDGFYINENLDPRWPEAETAANARLIAAAPELLKMLELAVRELEWADKNCQIKPMAGVSTFKSAVAQIKSITAKATGGAE